MNTPTFVDAEALGQLLGGVSSWTVKSWARRTVDGLPAYKAGRRLVFDPDEARQWFLEHQRHAPGVPLPRRRPRRPRLPAGRSRVEAEVTR